MTKTSFNRRCVFVSASMLASLLVLGVAGSCDRAQLHNVIEFEGTRLLRDTVQPNATDVWALRMRAFRPATLTIEGEAGSRLKCVVLDPDQKPLNAERDSCRIAWTPSRTGTYRLEVTNTQAVAGPYTVLLR